MNCGASLLTRAVFTSGDCGRLLNRLPPNVPRRFRAVLGRRLCSGVCAARTGGFGARQMKFLRVIFRCFGPFEDQPLDLSGPGDFTSFSARTRPVRVPRYAACTHFSLAFPFNPTTTFTSNTRSSASTPCWKIPHGKLWIASVAREKKPRCSRVTEGPKSPIHPWRGSLATCRSSSLNSCSGWIPNDSSMVVVRSPRAGATLAKQFSPLRGSGRAPCVGPILRRTTAHVVQISGPDPTY